MPPVAKYILAAVVAVPVTVPVRLPEKVDAVNMLVEGL